MPTKKPKVNVVMDEQLLSEVDKIAARVAENRSVVIRTLIREALEARDAEHEHDKA